MIEDSETVVCKVCSSSGVCVTEVYDISIVQGPLQTQPYDPYDISALLSIHRPWVCLHHNHDQHPAQLGDLVHGGSINS